MNNTTDPVCPQCGGPLPGNSPAGLCPRCLMAVNMATETVPSAESADAPVPPKAPPPSPEEIAQHFPNFNILECLGRGGMGVVYRARQKSLNRLVALKLLAPEREKSAAFAQRFAAEAETLAKLNHPGIVTIFDFGQTNGLFYLVMEFVDGVTMRKLLETGRVSPREALAIVPQICDALQYAHDQGVVHRDIKPENILLDRRGRVKVADFGLAKLIGAAEGLAGEAGGRPVGPTLTQAGQVVGTPSYMAPEQFEHPSAVDHRADIYALGVVFYQMLTGELPARKLEPPSKKVQIDVRLDDVVLRALEKEPQRRYQQASQVKAAVETIATEPGSTASVPGESEQPPGVAVGWKVLLSSLVAAFLIVCGWSALASLATLKGFLLAVAISTTLLLAIFLVVYKARLARGFFTPLLLVFLLVFGIAALVTSIQNESYGSTARIKITPTRADAAGAPGLPEASGLYNPYLIQTELHVLGSEVILGKVVANLGWDRELIKRFRDVRDGRTFSSADILNMLRTGLSVRSVRNANIIEIQVFDGKADWAARLANEIARVYSDHANRPESPLQGPLAFQVEIVDHATPAWYPMRPNRPLNLLVAIAAGLSLGWVAAAVGLGVRTWKSRRL